MSEKTEMLQVCEECAKVAPPAYRVNLKNGGFLNFCSLGCYERWVRVESNKVEARKEESLSKTREEMLKEMNEARRKLGLPEMRRGVGTMKATDDLKQKQTLPFSERVAKPLLVGYIMKNLDRAILEKYLYRLSIRDLNDFWQELKKSREKD